MARVVISRAAREDLDRLVRTHSLPLSTRDRVRQALVPLRQFPEIGGRLEGRWKDFRFVLGPWRWMLIVYQYASDSDIVSVLTIQDARAEGSATSGSKAASSRLHDSTPDDVLDRAAGALTGVYLPGELQALRMEWR